MTTYCKGAEGLGQWYQSPVPTRVHLIRVQRVTGASLRSHLFSSFAELMAGFQVMLSASVRLSATDSVQGCFQVNGYFVDSFKL